jgi:hypothetical protein
MPASAIVLDIQILIRFLLFSRHLVLKLLIKPPWRIFVELINVGLFELPRSWLKLLISARTMVSGGTSLAVFGSSMALTDAGVNKSIRAQEHKSTRARHDLFVSTAIFIFRPFLIKA